MDPVAISSSLVAAGSIAERFRGLCKQIDPLVLGLLLFGLGNVGNTLWMLASPTSWYLEVPASVPDFGPLNAHFVRDLGAMFPTY